MYKNVCTQWSKCFDIILITFGQLRAEYEVGLSVDGLPRSGESMQPMAISRRCGNFEEAINPPQRAKKEGSLWRKPWVICTR